MERGDLLLLYTDGITEAMGPLRGHPSDRFGTDRLDRALLDAGASSAQECIGRVRSAVGAYSENAPPIDDQPLIALRCL